MGVWWGDCDRVKGKAGRKTCHSDILCTKNSSWNNLEQNPDICGESLANDTQCHSWDTTNIKFT